MGDYAKWLDLTEPLPSEQTGKSPPTKGELIRDTEFGKPTRDLTFGAEGQFDHILVPLLKSGYLAAAEMQALTRVHPLYDHLVITMERTKHVDFSTLADYDENWEKQQAISTHKVMQFLSAALHYDLHIAFVIRYAGGNYTADYRDVPAILKFIEDKVPHELYCQVQRLFTTGAPTKLNAHSTAKNTNMYRHYGNHSSVNQNIAKINKKS